MVSHHPFHINSRAFEKYANWLRRPGNGKGGAMPLFRRKTSWRLWGMVIEQPGTARAFTTTSTGCFSDERIPGAFTSPKRSRGAGQRTAGGLQPACRPVPTTGPHLLGLCVHAVIPAMCCCFPVHRRSALILQAAAFRPADRLQTPVILMSDLDLGMNDHVSSLEWDDNRNTTWARCSARKTWKTLSSLVRYLDVDGDGIPYRTIPGTHPTRDLFARATSKDEYARYTENGAAYVRNVDRLLKKWKPPKNTCLPGRVPGKNSHSMGYLFGTTDLRRSGSDGTAAKRASTSTPCACALSPSMIPSASLSRTSRSLWWNRTAMRNCAAC